MKNIKTQEASFGTGHTEVNDSNEYTSACGELVNEEGGEDQNAGILPNLEQMEPPTTTKRGSQVDIVVNTIHMPMDGQDQSYKKIQKMEENKW